MLTPKELDNIPDRMVELYAQAEADILADMARRISTYDYFIPAAEWQYKKLIEMGSVHNDIIKRLSSLTGKSKKELQTLMTEAGTKALKTDDSIYKEAGLKPAPPNSSNALLAVLNSGTAKTMGSFDNLTKTTARTAAKQFENALDIAYMHVTTGAFDTNTAIRNAVKSLTGQGLDAVHYPTGHNDSIEVAVRRAVLTGVNQTALKLQDTRADEMGCDLVEVSAHAGARPEHAAWQGRIFSRSGKSDKYPDFVQSTGYGTGAGLGGWNCRHSFYPFFEGVSAPNYSQKELAEMDAKTYEYNGIKMSEYEATQQQRAIERNIRRWKRENLAMQAAGQDTAESAAKIRRWQETEKDFLCQTGLKRQTDREMVGGFGKSEAGRATNAVAKYEKYRYNTNGAIIVTDDWKKKGKVSIPQKYRPHAIIETKTEYRNGTIQIDRTIYDSEGVMLKQIHSGPHNRLDKHPFGEHGEHAHEYTWITGAKRPIRTERNLSDSEKEEYKDILGGGKSG